jgi:hypothetical protein
MKAPKDHELLRGIDDAEQRAFTTVVGALMYLGDHLPMVFQVLKQASDGEHAEHREILEIMIRLTRLVTPPNANDLARHLANVLDLRGVGVMLEREDGDAREVSCGAHGESDDDSGDSLLRRAMIAAARTLRAEGGIVTRNEGAPEVPRDVGGST